MNQTQSAAPDQWTPCPRCWSRRVTVKPGWFVQLIKGIGLGAILGGFVGFVGLLFIGPLALLGGAVGGTLIGIIAAAGMALDSARRRHCQDCGLDF